MLLNRHHLYASIPMLELVFQICGLAVAATQDNVFWASSRVRFVVLGQLVDRGAVLGEDFVGCVLNYFPTSMLDFLDMKDGSSPMHVLTY